MYWKNNILKTFTLACNNNVKKNNKKVVLIIMNFVKLIKY